jgi:hypothetical protein
MRVLQEKGKVRWTYRLWRRYIDWSKQYR